MVKYWKTKDSVEAKVTKDPEGHYVMFMDGEKYPFPGFPRGSLLFGKLSKLKHEIKNQIFNRIWYALEKDVPAEDIMGIFRNDTLPHLEVLMESMKYDMVPFEKMVPPVKEIYRALSVVEEQYGGKIALIKDILTFILQEDDAYRMRFQDLVQYFKEGKGSNKQRLKFAFEQLEHAEIVGDMKERQRLWKSGFSFFAWQPGIGEAFDAFVKELDFKKVYLTKADKYFFRAKYYKVDRRNFDY